MTQRLKDEKTRQGPRPIASSLQRRLSQTNVTSRIVQDLTLDQGGGRMTGCVYVDYCSRDCACYKAGGACCETCGCKGERGCGLRIKVFNALFGTHLNIKLTPYFAGYISHVSQDAHRNGTNALRLLTLLGAQKTGMDILLARGGLVEAAKDHGTELRELVRLLVAQAVPLNHGFHNWPFHLTTKSRGGAALAAWHGRRMATSGRETRETLQLNQELLRYAFTDKSHYDCYYSFCAHKWVSKALKFHCEACKQCWPSFYVHCVTCQNCINGDLAVHRAEVHEWGSDDD